MVVGGSVGLAEGYLALVETYLAQEPAAFHVDLLAAHYRHDAGLLGAALLAQWRKIMMMVKYSHYRLLGYILRYRTR